MFDQTYRAGNKQITVTPTKPGEGMRLISPVRTMLHIPKRFRVKAGTVLFQNGKPVYLLSQHHSNNITDVFGALEVNEMVKVSHTVTDVHPVTQMKKDRTVVGEDLYPACKDVVSNSEVVGLKDVQVIYYLAKPVTTTNLINGKRVQSCIAMSGLYRVEVG